VLSPVALGCRGGIVKLSGSPRRSGKHILKKENIMTKYEELYEQQHRNELRGFDLGLERYHTNRSKVISNPNKDNTTLAPEMTLLTKLMSKAVVAIQADIAGGSGSKRYRKACKMCQTMINCGYTHERLAFLTLQMCFNVDGKRTYQNAQTTFIKIGKTCKKDYEYMQLMDEAPAFLSKVEESLRSSHMQHRQKVIERARRIVRRKDGTVGMTDMDWSDDVLFSIGRMLAEAVCRSTDLFEMKPIVQGITDQERGERSPMNCITPTKECEKHRGDLNQRMEIMHPLVFPMLIKPKAWTNAHSGGLISEYQQIDACVIKYRYKESVTVAEEAGMGEMFKALNAIQDTPFKINKEIRDVVKVTRTNGAGKLPAPDKNEMLPIKPWDTEEQINEMKASNNPVWIAWKRETAKQYDKWHRENSKRTALINQLRLADDFGDYDQLYWIWTVDYRGRAYPEQDWVSPQGDDVGRALMLFAEGKALGEHGSDWLAIHGANCYGIDKVPFQDRINWVLENKNNILASADRPLDFKWWEEADKPYQFLAFCFEWAGFMDEGEAFVSYLPIQMDGTCSGLQHFSGLLKDQVGGDAVNLNPNDVPADVYAEVAIVTNKLLHQLKKMNRN
jgi:DNA-directed RNA polymerase